MKIAKTLKQLEINEAAQFPISQYCSVKDCAYRLKITKDLKFKTKLNIDEKTVSATRIK